MLYPEKNTMLAFGALAKAVFGTASVIDGLVGTQTTVPSLSINIGPGSITSLQNVDNSAFGSVAPDTADQIVKQGFNLTSTVLALTAPGTVGQSINYLIEAEFLESDSGSTVLPYVNAALPSSPYNGPGNAGTSQNTQRIQRVSFTVKAGAAAATGSQVTPGVDSGYVPLYVVPVAYGQTAISTAQIIMAAGAPFVDPNALGRGIQPGRLIAAQPQIFKTAGTFTYTPTPGTNSIEVEVMGAGGGSGGIAASNASGICISAGGSAGSRAVSRILSGFGGVTVTVGAGGAAGALGTNAGGTGGTSSFGALVTAPGGPGGASSPPTSLPQAGAATTAVNASGGSEINAIGNLAPYSFGFVTSGTPYCVGGLGGSSPYGAGGNSVPAGQPAQPGYGNGSGAGGVTNILSSPGSAGAKGADGIVIVREYS